MILPSVRSGFGREEAVQLAELLGRDDPETLKSARARLDEEGMDTLLDDPRVLNAVLTEPNVPVRPDVIFYVLVRQALLEGGIQSRAVADYATSLIIGFGREGRANRISEGAVEEFRYLADLVINLESAGKRRTLLLSAHLGNYSLWMAGLFPQHVAHRTQRRGAPPISYFDEMGATGFRIASGLEGATALGLDQIFADVADHFQGVRVALNRISDRHLWRGAGDPESRVLREIEQRF